MAIFCDEDHPSVSTGLNYLFGSLLPVIFLTALILNPMIFLYNYRRKPSIATTLFMMLAVVDFLTISYQPVMVTIRLLNSNYCHDHPRPSSNLEKVSTIFMAPVMQTAGMITTLMSITRYIQIRSPFYRIRKKLLIIYFLLYISFLLFSYIYVLFSSRVIFDPYIQQTWRTVEGQDWWALGMTFPYTTHVLLAAVTSILTVKRLWGGESGGVRNGGMERKIEAEKRGCMTVLLMNIGNFVMFGCNIVYLFMKVRMNDSFYFNFIKFLTWCFLPLSLSALNPLIIVTRSTGFKNTWQLSDSAFPESHVVAGHIVQQNADCEGRDKTSDKIKLASVFRHGNVRID